MSNNLYKTLLRTDFYSFLLKAFSELNPGKNFSKNVYVNLMIDYLDRVKKNKIKRLIINIPPRSLKSILISVAWPAWLLGINPTLKIIVVSYNKELTIKHSEDTRLIMNSEWYQKIFPETKICNYHNRNNKFITTKQGFRIATSTHSSLTGEGADIIIIDDPINAIDAYSNIKLAKTNNWFEQSLLSRLNDRKNGKIILVMQRLDYQDLSGYLLNKKPNYWTHLKLPLIAQEDLELNYKDKKLKFRKGTILNSTNYNQELVKELKYELGDKIFNSQYQQEPIKQGDTILNKEYINFYDELPSEKEFIVLSLDSAVKENKNNDFSAFTIWQVTKDASYLIFAIKRRLNFPNLKNLFIQLAETYKVNLAIIEDKASGSSLIQELSSLNLKIVPFQSKLNKIARLDISLISFMQQKILFPKNVYWVEEYLEELLNFPNYKFDDFVDSTTQFICYWQKKYKQNIKIISV